MAIYIFKHISIYKVTSRKKRKNCVFITNFDRSILSCCYETNPIITITVKGNRVFVFVFHPLKICSRRYIWTRRTESKWCTYFLGWSKASRGREVIRGYYSFTPSWRGRRHPKRSIPLLCSDEQYVILGQCLLRYFYIQYIRE